MQIHFGSDSVIHVDFAESCRLLTLSDQFCGEPLDDPAAAIAAAVESPLHFPPLAEAVIDGDHVVLAIDEDAPCLAAVISGVIHGLELRDGRFESLTILLPPDSKVAEHTLTAILPAELRDSVTIARHDPTNSHELSYLGATEAGEAIRVNHHLANADFVLPIGTLRPAGSLGYFGVHSGLFPLYSDADTVARFQAAMLEPTESAQHLREDMEQMVWQLGVMVTLQLLPSGGDQLLHAICGPSADVTRAAAPLTERTWGNSNIDRAELVVTSLAGGDDSQTWNNFARTLDHASRNVDDGGAVVICSSLREEPSRSLCQTVADAYSHFGDEYDESMYDDPDPNTVDMNDADRLASAVLKRVRDRVRVYLLSDLPDDSVEQLGLVPLLDGDEIGRLSAQFQTCRVIG